MLRRLLSELHEVHMLASERQPTATQARLSKMTAIIATLIADSLMKLGNLTEAHAWYGTAQTAADDSGNRLLRSRVRAQTAMLPYYYGPIEAAVRLASEARLLAGPQPTETAAFAAAAEARAYARQGNAAAALHALNQAQELFSKIDPRPDNDAFAFPERRLYLYMSGVFTHLCQHGRARAVRQRGLQLYEGQAGIDPALLHIEEAICLAQEHALEEACQMTSSTYLKVPAEHRTLILGIRARDVMNAIPRHLRTARPARELKEVLALPPGDV